MRFLGSARRAERNIHSSKDSKFNIIVTNDKVKESFHVLQTGSNTKEHV